MKKLFIKNMSRIKSFIAMNVVANWMTWSEAEWETSPTCQYLSRTTHEAVCRPHMLDLLGLYYGPYRSIFLICFTSLESFLYSVVPTFPIRVHARGTTGQPIVDSVVALATRKKAKKGFISSLGRRMESFQLDSIFHLKKEKMNDLYVFL